MKSDQKSTYIIYVLYFVILDKLYGSSSNFYITGMYSVDVMQFSCATVTHIYTQFLSLTKKSLELKNAPEYLVFDFFARNLTHLNNIMV